MSTTKAALKALALAFLVCVVARPAATDQGPEPAAFAEAAREARHIWRPYLERWIGIPPATVAEVRTRLAKYAEPGAPGRPVTRHLMARVLFLGRQKAAAEDEFVAGFATAMAPEDVVGVLDRRLGSGTPLEPLVQCLSDLLPLSGWRNALDVGVSEFHSDVKTRRGPIPRRDRKAMIEIAECLEQAGLYELAWRAYAEAVYGGFSIATVAPMFRESWLSPDAAEYWAKAARCARMAGRQELAWDYLMKAAVFGSDKLFEEAQETAKQWASQAEARVPPLLDPQVKREALTRAVRLYADINAHPRALGLIDEYRDAFEDPDRLRKEVEAQWLAVVKDVSRMTTRLVLYGYEVYPNGDPLKVRIPWALSDEALASVGERLQALHAADTKAPEAAKPGQNAPPEAAREPKVDEAK